MGLSVVLLILFVSMLICTWRVFHWVWLKPKKLERCLRKQGLKGNPYKFYFGDLKEMYGMIKETKPINFSHHIVARVNPFMHQTIKHHGKNSFVWVGPVPRVNIMETDEIRDVFNKHNVFQKPSTNPMAKLLTPGIGSSEGEKWSKHRNIINPAFHHQRLKVVNLLLGKCLNPSVVWKILFFPDMLPGFYQSCVEMISKWEKLVCAKEESCELDIWPDLVSLSSDAISRTAFGSSYQEGIRIFQLQSQLAHLIKQLIQSVPFPGRSLFPTKLNKEIKRIDKEIDDSLKMIIKKREKAIKSNEVMENKDLLGVLLESNFKEIEEHGNNTKCGLSIKDVIDECKLFYFAGKETTSTLLAWTLVLLSKHMDWQTRAREEVFHLFGSTKPDDYDALNHLKVVTMILYEVLRLYPPVDFLPRTVSKDMKLGKFVLPAGVQISLPMLFVHHDPKFWGDDASEFKPERFSDGIAKATNNQLCYFPFGWGPRICVGQNFAMLEAKMALVLILQKFWFDLSPSYAHAPFPFTTIQPQFGAQIILHKL